MAEDVSFMRWLGRSPAQSSVEATVAHHTMPKVSSVTNSRSGRVASCHYSPVTGAATRTGWL
jgi:hypothetical protein